MELKFFEEQVFFATVRITIAHEAGAGVSIGTGFLYTVPVSQQKNCILLVSNRHVYGDPNRPLQIVFNKVNPEDPSRPLLGDLHVLSADTFDGVYTPHPDPTVDLACINISAIGHSQPAVFYKNLDDSLLADFTHERLLPGNPVWFVGYPENRFDTTHNLPILRRGHIASVPKVDFEGRCEFLIDAQVFPGSSGSPVFTELGGRYVLVGVVAQTMIKNERVQAVPTTHALAVGQTLGLGIVLKATMLRQLLDAATESIRRRVMQDEPEPVTTSEITEESVPS